MFDTIPAKPYQTKEEYVYGILRGAIMDGRLRPGDKLVIDNLRSELGVSTIPIRTVLQRLEVEGLVDIRPHTGAIVSHISLHDVAEVFTLLETLESVAFKATSQVITDAELKKLAAIVRKMDAAVEAEEPDQWAALNTQLHLSVAELARMPLLHEFTRRVLGRWDRLRSLYLREYVLTRMSLSQEDHRQMIHLLELRDGPALAELAKQHNRNAHDAFRAYFSETEMGEAL